MKIGNTSLSNVPVPNFFLNKNLKQMECFEVSTGKKYFREKDLFRNTRDINFCNNPRNLNRKHENFNRTKFSPDKTNLNNFLKTASDINTTSRKKFFSTNKDREKENPKPDSFANFRHFMEKTNVANTVNPELREEIKTNINVLIEKITHNYDLDKWGSTDTRTNFINLNSRNENTNFTNNMNSTYNQNGFPFSDTMHTNFNFNTTSKFDEKNFNQTDASKFKTILRDKINGMTLDKKLKDKLIANANNDLNNETSPSDKFYKTKTSNIVNIYNEDLPTHDSLGTTNETKFDDSMNTIQASRTSYAPRVKYTNNINNEININDNFYLTKICLPQVMTKYSTVSDNMYNNQVEVERLKSENKKIYDRFKTSNLFKDFPSPDRKEFIVKKGELLRTNMRKDKVDKTLVDFSKYNASKHKSVFCENYGTNQGVLNKFKKNKDTFV